MYPCVLLLTEVDPDMGNGPRLWLSFRVPGPAHDGAQVIDACVRLWVSEHLTGIPGIIQVWVRKLGLVRMTPRMGDIRILHLLV